MGPSSAQVQPGTPPDIRSRAPLGRQVVQHHPVVRERDLDAPRAGREPAKASEQRLRPRARSWPTLISGTISHPGARLASRPAESVGDAAPLFHRRPCGSR